MLLYPATAQQCRSETEKNILEDLFNSVLLQFKKHRPSGNLKFNYLRIFQSLKLRKLMVKILRKSLWLNFTPNTLGCYGFKFEKNQRIISSWNTHNKGSSFRMQSSPQINQEPLLMRGDLLLLPRYQLLFSLLIRITFRIMRFTGRFGDPSGHRRPLTLERFINVPLTDKLRPALVTQLR